MNARNFRRLTPAAFRWQKVWRHARLLNHGTLFACYPADLAMAAIDARASREMRPLALRERLSRFRSESRNLHPSIPCSSPLSSSPPCSTRTAGLAA